MVIRGTKKGTDDDRKYFVRLVMKNKQDLTFGQTMVQSKIEEKVYIRVITVFDLLGND